MDQKKQKVVVVGASPNPERYSNRAVCLLLEHGHGVLPVHPSAASVEGLPVIHDLADLSGHIDTVTLYVSAEKSSGLADALIALSPDRVVFNPGAENPGLRAELEARGVKTVEACTLVLLKTGQF
jgi:predicted CoA-binding protein